MKESSPREFERHRSEYLAVCNKCGGIIVHNPNFTELITAVEKLGYDVNGGVVRFYYVPPKGVGMFLFSHTAGPTRT